MNLHEQLVEKSLPIITSYHDDLLKHDKNHLDNFPGRPFIHFTGDTGTHIITLWLFEDYPSKFEEVPYIFGTAGRQHILDELTSTVDCMKSCNRMELIMYFDGLELRIISYETAKSKVAEYTRKMKKTFMHNNGCTV